MRSSPTNVLILAVLVSAPVSAQSDPGREAFLAWAKRTLSPLTGVKPSPSRADLAPLGKMVGAASIVALSEGVHAGAEPLEFRNRVFQYLVEELGFTAIAIESGIAESRVVHDYVLGGPGDLATTLAQGITWTFDRLPQNAALVRWIRDYNADPKHVRKVNFYGFDVPGSPGNPMANRGMRTALDEALRWLGTVDGPTAAAFHLRLDSLLPSIHLDPRSTDGPQYPRLSQAERDVITGAIADLIAVFERREARYTAASSAASYQWAYRTLLGARSGDGWLRQIPIGWQASAGMTFFSEATDIRDRAQADNLSWIVSQEGPNGKVLVFASRYHLSTAPVRTSLSRGGSGNAVAGTYLRPRFGDRLITIANLIGQGTWGCTGFTGKLEQPPPGSMDRIAGELGRPLFLLDLRPAPAPVTAWLNQEHQLGEGQGTFELVLGKAFDVFFYLDTVTPACPK